MQSDVRSIYMLYTIIYLIPGVCSHALLSIQLLHSGDREAQPIKLNIAQTRSIQVKLSRICWFEKLKILDDDY